MNQTQGRPASLAAVVALRLFCPRSGHLTYGQPWAHERRRRLKLRSATEWA